MTARRYGSIVFLLALDAFTSCAPAPPIRKTSAPRTSRESPAPPRAAAEETAVLRIKRHAVALREFARTNLAKEFLAAAESLPSYSARRVYHDAEKTYFVTEHEASRLSSAERRVLVEMRVDEEYFYTTKYGSPLAYVRPVDLIGSHTAQFAGKRVLDFGYGTIGHLRMFASLGANVTGIEVDPLLRALYSEPGDQGFIKGVQGRDGQLTLLHGKFPAEPAIVKAAGVGYDLFLSKNVLKRGYIHPEQPVKEQHQIKLGVTDEVFVERVFEMLNPGGFFFIYNITPAPNTSGKPYRTWADGRCPFTQEMLLAAGFRVLAYDHDDSPAIRAMGHELEWDRGEDAMDLEQDLHAQYSLAEKPVRR